MKNLFFLFLFFTAVLGYSQKQTAQTFDAEGIKTIVISSDEVYHIEIATAAVTEISLITRAEGEYFQDIGLVSTLEEDKLILESRYRENLQGGFDKLSAHKVFSLKVMLVIPENLTVTIESNIASVIATGKYKNIQVQLKQGDFEAVDFIGDALINTFTGDIFLKIKKDAVIEASSRNGIIDIPKMSRNDNSLKLMSLSGNIKVIKTK